MCEQINSSFIGSVVTRWAGWCHHPRCWCISLFLVFEKILRHARPHRYRNVYQQAGLMTITGRRGASHSLKIGVELSPLLFTHWLIVGLFLSQRGTSTAGTCPDLSHSVPLCPHSVPLSPHDAARYPGFTAAAAGAWREESPRRHITLYFSSEKIFTLQKQIVMITLD